MPETAQYGPEDIEAYDWHRSDSETRRTMDFFAGAWRAERAVVGQFVRSLYSGRIEEHGILYDYIPQWLRDAIESDEVYK